MLSHFCDIGKFLFLIQKHCCGDILLTNIFLHLGLFVFLIFSNKYICIVIGLVLFFKNMVLKLYTLYTHNPH